MSELPGAAVSLLSAPPDGTAPRPLAAQRVLPLRRPGRWILTAIVLVLVAQIGHGLVTNPFYQWDRFAYWFLRPTILDGLLITLEVAAYSAVLGLLGGILLALARLSRSPVLRAVSWVYVWLLRSVPLIVVLIFLYNFSALYKTLSLGVPFGPAFLTFDESRLATDMAVAVVGLSLNEAAYAAEVVRGGILSVDQGQHEAAAALGLPKSYQFTKIVFPQALRSITPNYVNQLIGLIKGTSLVFYVSLLDLFGSAQTMGSTYPGDIVPLLLVVTVWYLILTSIVSVVQFYVERHYARGATRSLPPTPLQKLRTALGDLRARIRREAAL
ncbi:polar amino acid ABC transporter permease [Streptomyces avermitilis]|uniref:Putative amino acid ABC transporter, permease protein n=1 Tax=Streptomyces avermitilis TaxID=33903 RepID=A0A4D4MK99_STRAX|nr:MULTISPECIES: amino acid ABC transporter permease [Streptomyces]KUN53031.1 polar amino acid ABC transporter permease [Streptomyces avermitilis]MYT02749.1 ABC transporter permease subunit [Streptomyces sp. SID5469]OOV24970.1 polar amino acid ABC transporter permease [Streptomyces avermitilis]BBJ55540.1 putative amino acid ABC transporter, permease protein [Streptomyces avermitilis]GDY67500.1 putative amino acid ABC transporter, permease protein [Streptomyces avermitilis]